MRTGSPFGEQARFPLEQVKVDGRSTPYVRVGDSGATVYWQAKQLPAFIAVAVGAFADANFPAPQVSVYEERAHPWVMPATGGMEHMH